MTLNSFLLTSALALHVTATSLPVIKLGMVYDPTGPFQNAYLAYTFYAYKMNLQGGLVVGMAGNQTTYQIKIIGHSTVNATDPYWVTSGSRKFHRTIARMIE